MSKSRCLICDIRIRRQDRFCASCEAERIQDEEHEYEEREYAETCAVLESLCRHDRYDD